MYTRKIILYYPNRRAHVKLYSISTISKYFKREKMMAQKIVIIGLDGTNLEFIGSWIKSGELPNLKKILENGVWGEMKSVLPPVTVPNWKCYSTGKNPGKLGIFWWENIDVKNGRIYLPFHRIYENKEIWDYLSADGKKVGVINVPSTYPPKKVNGFMICGGPDAKDVGFTYPANLEYYLKEKYNYKVHTKMFPIKDRRVLEEILTVIESRFKVAKDLLIKNHLDFLHVTIFYINVLQHHFGAGDYTKTGWKVIDKNIGELLEQLDDNYNIIIMSDHGSNEIKQVFNINNWLETEGYLKLKNMKLLALIHRLGINREKLSKILNNLGFTKRILQIIPDKIINYIPTEEGSFATDATYATTFKAEKIDWKKTKVLASGQGPIYINLDRNSNEYRELRDKLIEKLETLKNPHTGNQVVEKVYRKEELYVGKFVDEAPDLVADQTPGTHICGGISSNYVFTPPRKWKGENKKIGTFIASGKDINEGKKISNISILDLAPTILHLMGTCVPEDMDGRVLKEIFSPHSEPARRKVTYSNKKERIKQVIQPNKKEEESYAEENKERLMERLEKLGYL